MYPMIIKIHVYVVKVGRKSASLAVFGRPNCGLTQQSSSSYPALDTLGTVRYPVPPQAALHNASRLYASDRSGIRDGRAVDRLLLFGHGKHAAST